MPSKKAPNFEKSLEELEGIVHALEDGELSLEESLKTFERGINLTRQCQSALEDAEQRVNVLIEENDETRTEPFESEDDEA